MRPTLHETFSLTARDGYVSTPDGNSIYMWSYGLSSGKFQLPGPTLCVTSGQAVTVVLHNTLPEDTSIVFTGQKDVKADGKPAQPQLTDTGSMTSMVQPADATDGSVTYTFTAGPPGTYLYASGTDLNKQRQMGIYGALVVRPDGHPDQVNDRGDSRFNADKEYVFLLSEVDPDLHLAVENGEPVSWSDYRARYFMINGRSMPDTLAPNHASWLPNQPYGALVHIAPYDATDNPRPAAIRYLNAGTVNYPFHPHGSDERVVNVDGRALDDARERPVVPEVRHRRATRAVGRRPDGLARRRELGPGDQPDPDDAARAPGPDAGRDRHLVQREPVPGHEGRPPAEHHRQQRVRRVLPRGPQPRAGASHQLRRDLRGDDDGLPHRPARRLPGELRSKRCPPSTSCPPGPGRPAASPPPWSRPRP